MTTTPATKQLAAAQKPEPTVVLAPCSDEEYAQRIAKPDEVKGYYVPGYLAA
jgi:hypothetical protein